MTTNVNFQVAKFLKEKGYKLCFNDYLVEDEKFPTIAEVVMWLYEKHNIWIVVNLTIDDRWYFELYNLKDKRNAEILVDYKDVEDYQPTMKASYEAAIICVLKYLI